MRKQRRAALLFTFILVVVVCTWFFLFREDEDLRLIGAFSFPLVSGAVSMGWLLRTTPNWSKTGNIFNRLLAFAVLLYFLANVTLIFLYFGEGSYPHLTHLLWLGSYAVFAWSLMYQLRLLNKTNRTYFFNIIIFMVVATSLSIHFLVAPLLSEDSLGLMLLTLAYPVADLLIVFLAINVFYLSRDTPKRQMLLLVTIGFIVQIIADSMYAPLLSDG
ncbi:hypothetical protein [Sporosarcina sp. Te-1]|uniref:hypothetical protein n=1 Tax=Sporosarcina sp. Te-1 TaxID=2818390 RepID=UPI001A9F284F|nr:hypothetical protein [Sporosarcina sp. Te-1]QTD40945.1 hypothetical protein J3U78_19750 [Sporosarcina sp. Te-1]